VRVGVISDTHGLLRPEAVEALTGVEHVLHAGDVGDPAILEALWQVAPVTAIRGNVDVSGDCARLSETELVELGGVGIYMLHDLGALDLDPVAAGVGVVISGHLHKAKIRRKKGVLYFNPGSAGPKRFSLPMSVGLLEIVGGRVEARVAEL
jgi:putative phosphoesterase